MNGSATAGTVDQREQRDSIPGGIKGSLKPEIPAFPPVLDDLFRALNTGVAPVQ